MPAALHLLDLRLEIRLERARRKALAVTRDRGILQLQVDPDFRRQQVRRELHGEHSHQSSIAPAFAALGKT